MVSHHSINLVLDILDQSAYSFSQSGPTRLIEGGGGSLIIGAVDWLSVTSDGVKSDRRGSILSLVIDRLIEEEGKAIVT